MVKWKKVIIIILESLDKENIYLSENMVCKR